MAGMPPPFPYYGHSPHPSGGQFRSPYAHMPHPSGSPSLQSMTSHWNLPPPVSSNPPHSGGAGPKRVSSSNSIGGLKPPKPPEKPLLPYMRYSRKMWEQFKKTEGSDLKVWEVGKIIGQKWRELSDDDKQPYFDEYENEKIIYDENMRTYKNSHAYKQYLEAKKIADRQVASMTNSTGMGGLSSHSPVQNYVPELGPPPPSVIAPPRHPANDPRIIMLQQQQEEDEEDEYLTTKQLAAVRFHRNHRLMSELFNDTVVPDTRSIVTNARLESLKMQAESLSVHQKKLEDEVQQLETNYTNKRAQFLEDAERFRRELKRIQDNPPITWKKPQVQLSSKDIPEPLKSAQYIKL